jgi:hypothetical protein
MTETQATSGTSGTSTNPADAEPAEGSAGGGRAAVGRATVPAAESPGGTSPTGPASSSPSSGAPRYTRAPGMAAPPDAPSSSDGGAATAEGGGSAGAAGSATVAGAGVPVVAPPVPVTVGAPGPGTGVGTAAVPAGAVGGQPRPGVRLDGSIATGRVSVGTLPPRPGTGAVGAARVGHVARGPRTASSAAAARGPRRARLSVKRIDPWSVMKFSFAVSLVLFIVIIVATAVLYLALDAMGVFDSLNQSLGDLVSSAGGDPTGGNGFKITAKGVIGTAALLGAVNVVLVTALATLGAFIYNVCADLVGGIELTLSERD